MIISRLAFLTFGSLIVLSGCQTLQTSSLFEQKPAPVTKYGSKSGAGSAGVHTVGSGETLYKIAQRYRVDMPAIISVNKLSAPFRLAVGQRLTLPPPREYSVRYGDTLYGIARLFNVTQQALVTQNNLMRPYKIVPGQKLLLPSVASQIRQLDRPERQVLTQPLPSVAVKREVLAPPSEPVSAPVSLSTSFAPKAEVPDMRTPLSKPAKFIQPVNGKVISSYGPKKSGLHNDGINISAPRNTPVLATADGEVVYAGNALKGYGNLVLVKHGGGYLSAYGHLGKITVEKGQRISQGEQIGVIGTSGQVTEPQLHFEIREGTNALDPAKYI